MNILTIYTESASKLLSVLDDLACKKPIKVIASDPNRLYNDSTHNDVSMASITIMCDESHAELTEHIACDYVYVCVEDPSDWV